MTDATTWFRPPRFAGDADSTRRAVVVHVAAWIVLGLQAVAVVVPLYPGTPLRQAGLTAILATGGLAALAFLHARRLRLASDALALGVWAGTTFGLFTGGDTSSSYISFGVVVLLAGLLRGPRVSGVFLAGAIVVGAAAFGMTPAAFAEPSAPRAVAFQGFALRTILLMALWAITVITGRSVDAAVSAAVAAQAERARSAVSLAGSEERLRAVLEHASDLITVHDPTGRVRYASAAARRMVGYDVGPDFEPIAQQVFHPDDVLMVQLAFRRAIADRVPQTFECRLRHVSGDWLYVESVVAAVDDPAGVARVVATTRNISERKRLDSLVLRISRGVAAESGEGFLKTLVGQLAAGLGLRCSFVAEVLPTLDRARTIAFHGPDGLEPNFEYDLEGAPCRDVLFGGHGVFVLPRGAARAYPHHAGLARREIEAYAGHPLFAADGAPLGLLVVMDGAPFVSPSWVESVLRIFAIRAEDELERMRAAGRQQHLEEQLRQSQKLETIGQLAGGIAHDFNNLLTPVLGYADILLDDIHPTDPRRRQMMFIREAAEKATALTRQLLSFSRRQVLDLRPMELNRVVVGFQRILRRTIRENIHIDVATSAIRSSIVGDESQIEQILMNLAVNAQDAMPTGGSIRITTSEVDLPAAVGAVGDVLPGGSYVVLSVRDDGVGMSDEVRTRVFEPFFTTKEKGRGTGLGLATVYGIVRQHRGTIDVESEPGRGSTFRIYFPLAAERRESAPATVPARQTGHETIAVVEDDPSVRELTCMVLRRYGYTVMPFDGSDACLAHAASAGGCHADVLLTDVVMPGLNGRQLYERLSATRPDLRVLYMSGYSADVISAQGLLEEGIALLQKPFAPEALLGRVRQILDS